MIMEEKKERKPRVVKPRVTDDELIKTVTRYCNSTKVKLKTLSKCKDLIEEARKKNLSKEIERYEKELQQLREEADK